jgi:hypothetical protein
MKLTRSRRFGFLILGTAVVTVVALSTGSPATIASAPRNHSYVEHVADMQGGASREGEEAKIAAEQFAFARTAPSGVTAPGAYDGAYSQLASLPTLPGSWSEVTNRPYDSDDPSYRDPVFSNSSGGAGLVTGRVTGIAVGADGTVYAGGADGGVFRSSNGGASWTAIADSLASLSVGDLRIAPDGALWFATGEGNTGSTAFVGSGVYRLTNPTSGSFTAANRVGDSGDGTNVLAGKFINKIRFDDQGRAYAATSRGLYRHSST